MLGKPGLRWEDNIKMVLKEIGCVDVGWIHMAHDGDKSRALLTRSWTLVFHKLLGISCPAEKQVVFQGLCSIESGNCSVLDWAVPHFNRYHNSTAHKSCQVRMLKTRAHLPTDVRSAPSSLPASLRFIKTGNARSQNNCCSGKARSITYSVCMFVALVIQHAKRMRPVTFLSVDYPAVQNFSTVPVSHKWHDFRERSYGTKNVFWSSLQVCLKDFLF
jgi:hypothetical protein